ncbi:MAG TPA: M23 family metallopeptidase [Solirubrobacteraceae bacterium]|nr:M23 family metallopeptidase [Solirubrobacteraceae bacterium]
MRPWLLAPVVALLLVPAAASAQDTGGAPAPSKAGGAEYGTPVKPKLRAPLVASRFSVQPSRIVAGGSPARIVYRVDGPARRVRVRVELVRRGARAAALRLRLGWKHTNELREARWAIAAGALQPGAYVARLHAVDDAGRTLRRTATASGRRPVHVEVASAPAAPGSGRGVFPVGGTGWTFGGDGARFGARRNGHVHQGQDIMAPEGTPVLAPRAGFVFWRAVQKGGAGHYLVVRADDGRDYVFMHLVAGSETVAKGDPVAAGQAIAQVGSTGSSEGPHLHFEIWPGGWYGKDAKPIDPRPDLEAWAAAAG